MEIVEGNDVVRDVGYLESHVLGAIHWRIEVEIFDVHGHEAFAFDGDDAVKEDFGGTHVGYGCATITGEDDSVTSNSRQMEYGSSFSGQKFAHILLHVTSFLHSGSNW